MRATCELRMLMLLKMAPPTLNVPPVAELPVSVLLTTVRLPVPLKMAAPKLCRPPVTELPESVLLTTVSVPLL